MPFPLNVMLSMKISIAISFCPVIFQPSKGSSHQHLPLLFWLLECCSAPLALDPCSALSRSSVHCCHRGSAFLVPFPWLRRNLTSSTPAASDFFAARACLALRPFVALTLSVCWKSQNVSPSFFSYGWPPPQHFSTLDLAFASRQPCRFSVGNCACLPNQTTHTPHGSNGNNFRRRSMREGNFNFKLAIGSENRLALDLLHRRTSSFSPHSVLHTVRTQSPSVRRPSVSLRVSSSMAAIMMMTMMAHTNTH